MTRKAIRKDAELLGLEQVPPSPKHTVSLRFFMGCLTLCVVLIALLAMTLVVVLSFMFRTPQDNPPAPTLTPRPILLTATPQPTDTPTPTVTPDSITNQALLTAMFGWFDASANDYSFFINDKVTAGQTYALCWTGKYIDGDSLALPTQQADIQKLTGQAGACVSAIALPNDKRYKIGFVSQAVRHAFVGDMAAWPILAIEVYEVPVGTQTLPYPQLKLTIDRRG